MATQTNESRAQIAAPKAYCSETRFREMTGYTNQLDLPSADLNRFLLEATEQVKRDAFIMRREELVTADSEGRYFPLSGYFANKYGRSFNTGKVTAEDLTVYETDTASTVGTAIYGTTVVRQRRIKYNISHAIDEVNLENNYFTLQSGYPTNNRQVRLTYCYVGKPMAELVGIERPLENACIEMTNIIFLRWLRDRRLKKGTTTLTLGSQTIAKDEDAVKDLINNHYEKYHLQINWMKPLRTRAVTVGRGYNNYGYRSRYGGGGIRYN